MNIIKSIFLHFLGIQQGDYDFIDYDEFTGKDIAISKDYDYPVKHIKVERIDLKESGEVPNLFEVDGNFDLDIEENSLLKKIINYY